MNSSLLLLVFFQSNGGFSDKIEGEMLLPLLLILPMSYFTHTSVLGQSEAGNGTQRKGGPSWSRFDEQDRSARAWIPSRRAETLRFHQEFANAGDHLGAVQLDRGHEGLMRETSHPVFQVEAGRAESGESCRDFLGDGLWRSHVERSFRPNLTQKGFPGRDGEAAGLADAADDLPVARPELFAGLLVGHGDMTRRVHAHRQRRAPETLQGLQEQL